MSNPSIKFGELPPGGRQGNSKWATIAAQLRERPGQWALATSMKTQGGASGTIGAIRRGAYASMPAGQFEAVSRGCDVWVRYVGEDVSGGAR